MGTINTKFNRKPLTAFTVSSLVQDACIDVGDTSFDITLYHNGNGVYPLEGDTVYTNNFSFSLLTTTDHFMSNNQFLRVDEGIVIPIICN